MIRRNFKEVEQMVLCSGGTNEYEDIVIKGVSIDSRTLKAGNLFVPIIGESFDGHQFIKEAIKNGAVAALWKRDVPNPPKNFPLIYVEDTLLALQSLARSYRNQLAVKVVGITGSNGKTTTKDMLASILSTTFNVQKTEGNLNNHLGLPLTILRLAEDTEMAVLEMGMSGRGEIELLSEIARPNATIITNIGESHLQDLGSRDAIAEAKLEIIKGLEENGVLVYNGDEPLLERKLQNTTVHTIRFGTATSNDLYPLSIKLEGDGTYFTVNKASSITFFIPVLGKHNVNNALATIAVADLFGVKWENMKNGLQKVKMTTMRMEMVNAKNGLSIINDAYNASPTSMNAAIELISGLKGYEKKLVVLGDMLELGENEVNFHQEIGRQIDPSLVDYVFTFGTLGAQIAEGAKKMFPNHRVKPFSDKRKLIEELANLAGTEDIVLVKASRGMKLEEVVTALKQS